MHAVRPVDSEGRILLPADVREELGIEPGDKVTITMEDEEVTIVAGEHGASHDLQRRGNRSPVRTGVQKPDRPDEEGDDG